MNNLIKVFNLTLLLTLFSCGEPEVIPQTAKLNIVFDTSSSEGKIISGRVEMANQLTFTTGDIVIREVVFDGTLEDGRSVSLTKEQVATIDFATGLVSPEVTFDISPGVYRDVYLGIELQDTNDNPTVVIEGTYTNSSEVVLPVRFEFNSGEVFEITDGQLLVNENADLIGVVSFNPHDWFSTVSLESMENATLTNGVIVISGSSNEDIFDLAADQLDVATDISISESN